MEMVVNYVKKGPTFRTKAMIAEELSVSEKTVQRLIQGVQKHIPERYSRYSVIGDRYNLYAIADYMKYRDFLESPVKSIRESVPEFSPSELAEIFGYESKIMKY